MRLDETSSQPILFRKYRRSLPGFHRTSRGQQTEPDAKGLGGGTVTRKRCFVSLAGVGPGIGLLRQVGKGHGPESVYSASKRFRAAQSGRREQRWLKANRCKVGPGQDIGRSATHSNAISDMAAAAEMRAKGPVDNPLNAADTQDDVRNSVNEHVADPKEIRVSLVQLSLAWSRDINE